MEFLENMLIIILGMINVVKMFEFLDFYDVCWEFVIECMCFDILFLMVEGVILYS